jgi:hypothetical protein
VEKKKTIVKKPALKKKKVVNKIVKKEKPVDFKKLIASICEENENLILMDIDVGSAFIIKKKTETVLRTLCAGSMNPVELPPVDMTFFHSFMITWGSKKIIKGSMIYDLKQREFPIYLAESEYDLTNIIKKA